MGISFLPGRISLLTLSVLMLSVLTNYVSVHVCTGAGCRDCIKSIRDKIGITRHIMMHQVLYMVQLPNEEGDMHFI